jgi:hypothetical protein
MPASAKLGVSIVYFWRQPTYQIKLQRRKALALRRLRFTTFCDPKLPKSLVLPLHYRVSRQRGSGAAAELYQKC